MRRLFGIAAVIGSLVTAGTAIAAPGDLDPAFGMSGQLTTPLTGADSGGANGMLIEPDGRIVVAGEALFGSDFQFAIGRYEANGTLDESFGDGGVTITDFTSTTGELANAVVRQADGKLVIAGEALTGTGNVLALARYHANGVLDSSFDGDGKLITDVQTTTGEEAKAIALQSTGKIVVAGYGQLGATNEIVLARYLGNGALDPTFGTSGNGKVAIPVTAGQGETATSLLVLPDDSLLVGGSVADSTGFNEHFMLRHLSKDGGIDGTFGDASGRLITTFPGAASNERIAGLARQPDGKIVAVGSSPILVGNEKFEVYVARYLPDGTLDPSFAGGTGREAFLLPGGLQAFGNADAIAPDGDIVIADTVSGNPMIARLLPDGTLDAGFGAGGVRVASFDSHAFDGADAAGVGLQADGAIVAAGDVQQGAQPGGFALMRVLGDNADLSLTASAAPASIRPHGTETLSVTAHNAGPQAAHLVTLTISPPAAAASVTVADAGTPAFTCTGTTPLECTIASLAAGTSSTVSLRYAAPATGPGHATASISSVTFDPVAANNSTGADATVDATPPVVHMKLGKVTLHKLRANRKLPVAVTVSESADVALLVKSAGKTLARASASFAGAGTRTVVCHLVKHARKQIAHVDHLTVKLRAVAIDVAGNTGVAHVTATLR